MRKEMKKTAAIALTIAMSVCSLSSCALESFLNKEQEIPVALPNYDNNLQFEYSAYAMASDGTWTVNGESYFYGEDFRSKERYAEMLDCGFTILRMSDALVYRGETWETSDAKKFMEEAYEAGFKKILVYDSRLAGSCWTKAYGEADSEYESEEAFDEWVKDCLAPYINMPGFYGLTLLDEPSYQQTEAYGQVYRSIRKVAKNVYGMDDIYLHINYLPIGAVSTMYSDDYKDHREMYQDYLFGYMDSTGCDRISVDTYAFRTYSFYPGFYSSIQVLANEVRDRGIELSYCLQSHESGGFRRVDKSDMRLEMNSLVGFGASHFYYYTYFPHGVDGGSFVTRTGDKTNIWYAGKELMADMQKFAPVVLNYKYKGAKMYTRTPSNFPLNAYLSSHVEAATGTTLDWDNSYEFAKLKNIEQDNDVVLSTELYDEKNDLYMYMVQNVIDPVNSRKGNTTMTVSVEFEEGYDYVAEFDCGELRYVPLKDGVYETTLSAGYAVYLIPLSSTK